MGEELERNSQLRETCLQVRHSGRKRTRNTSGRASAFPPPSTPVPNSAPFPPFPNLPGLLNPPQTEPLPSLIFFLRPSVPNLSQKDSFASSFLGEGRGDLGLCVAILRVPLDPAIRNGIFFLMLFYQLVVFISGIFFRGGFIF